MPTSHALANEEPTMHAENAGSTAARGAVRWTHPIPSRGALALATSSTHCFVGTMQYLLAITANGNLAWQRELPIVRAIGALPDQRLCIVTGNTMAIYHQETGECLASWPAPVASVPTRTGRDTLAYSALDPATRQRTFYHVALDGSILWTKHLRASAVLAPAAMATGILVPDDDLTLYSFAGEIEHRIGYQSVWSHDADSSLRDADRRSLRITSPILIDRTQSRAVVSVHGDHGAAVVLLDEAPFGVHTIVHHGPPNPKFALVERSTDGPPVLLHEAVPLHHGPDTWEYGVAMVALDGQVLWRHQVHSPVRALIGHQPERLIVACSPSAEEWDTYQAVRPLAGAAYLECLSTDGTVQWRWETPGPLTSTLGADPSGRIYGVIDGTLYCLNG